MQFSELSESKGCKLISLSGTARRKCVKADGSWVTQADTQAHNVLINDEIELVVVYDPNRDECFATMKGKVTTVNGKPITETLDKSNLKLSDTMALIDFKRLSPEIASELILKQPYRSQRSFGASALDLCWIAANRCQIYLHGKQMLWDHAAGLIILQNANAKATTFDHAPIFENNLKPKNVIAASNQRLMIQW